MQFLFISKNRVTQVYKEYTTGDQTIFQANYMNPLQSKTEHKGWLWKADIQSNNILKKKYLSSGIVLYVSSKLWLFISPYKSHQTMWSTNDHSNDDEKGLAKKLTTQQQSWASPNKLQINTNLKAKHSFFINCQDFSQRCSPNKESNCWRNLCALPREW